MRFVQAMPEGELRSLIVGNTLTGLQDGVAWYEFHSPNGRVFGTSEASGPYEAAYSFMPETICYDYPGDEEDGCWAIAAVDDGYRATNPDTGEAAGPMEVLPGNPKGLGLAP